MAPLHPSPSRLKHPALFIFLLGGVTGAALNVGLTLLLHRVFGLPVVAAFFAGTLANEIFHFLYYTVLHDNEEMHFHTPLPQRLALYAAVALLATLLLEAALRWTAWPLVPSLLAVLALLSAANTVLNRVSTYSSARLAEVEYADKEGDYYDEMTDPAKVSRFRAWYHASRYEALTRFVGEHHRRGMRMADLGCGNCRWNTRGVPVTGVDVNGRMLRWARSKGRLKDFRISKDLSRTGLPARRFDLVLMSETLEHLTDLSGTLAEVRRVLKDDGTFLVTVPWDFFLGPFFTLFNLNCLYMAYVKGSRYHRYRCGHVNHFTRGRLRAILEANGFELVRLFVVNGLLLYASARKREARR
jgi:SAM-dependent methyltransferase